MIVHCKLKFVRTFQFTITIYYKTRYILQKIITNYCDHGIHYNHNLFNDIRVNKANGQNNLL